MNVDAEPPATAFALAIIAQEEFAKAFLLQLVSKRVIAWNSLILRATRDHKCKQLLGLVMDYLSPEIDEFLKRVNEAVKGQASPYLPGTVADAITIFRHEKIGRWRSASWFWAEEPDYDPIASQTAEGSLDREKQNALYVRLSKTGEVVGSPLDVTAALTKRTMDRASRMKSFVAELLDDPQPSILDYEKVESAFKALFADLAKEADS
jgi:AbiV family abortive infection protein